MEDRFATLNGLRLHYLEAGRAGAPGFLILHGFGAHARDWQHVGEWLQDRYHVVALDQRGFGESAWAKDGDYGLQTNCDDVAALVEQLGWPRLTLLGFSLGARLALYFAGSYPDRVERLIMTDMGPEVAKAGHQRTRSMAANAPEEFASVEEAMQAFRSNYPYFRDDLYHRRMEYNLAKQDDGTYRLRWDPLFKQIMAGTYTPPGADQSIDLWQSLKLLNCPVIEIMGEHTDVITPAIAERMVQTNPRVQLATISNAAHTVHGDNPEEFRDVLMKFLGQGG